MFYETAKKMLSGNPIYEAARRARVSRRARRIEELQKKTYQERAILGAAALQPIKNARVLVVGAADGKDCGAFLKLGASEVHGLDVVEDVGRNFKHRRATYHRAGIEKSGLPQGYFDLVFSVATMEHVDEIEAGFAEMARIVKPGGVIFCHAAPLWQSPYGHHLGCFEGHPWAHVVYDSPQSLAAYAQQEGLAGERDIKIEWLIDYIFAPQMFNRRPAKDYLEAVKGLNGLTVEENVLICEPAAMLEHPLGQKALALGFSAQSLLGTQHNFVARK